MQFQDLADIEGARSIMMMSQSSTNSTTEDIDVRSIADVCDTAPCPSPNMDACNTTAPKMLAKKASKVNLLCDRWSLGSCFTLGEGRAEEGSFLC